MIHINIPSTQTFPEYNNPAKHFHTFDFYINGAYHSTVRYSHLFALHEKLIRNFGFRLKVDFPPKKFTRSLSNKQINRRKLELAQYFQNILLNPDVANHYLLERSFLDFQVNSYNPVSINVALEVFDSNGRKVGIKCGVRDPSSHILKSALEAFGVDLSLINHFGLFLAHDRKPLEKRYDGFDIIVKRCLKNFENPYVSMQLLNQKLAANGIFHKLVIRKVIYDPAIEESLLFDNGTLNLLYNQALNEFLNNRMDCDDQTKLSLREYAEEGEKISFLRLCHLQPTYGYEHLEDVETNYPHPNSLSSIKIGRRELILSVKDRDTEAVIESTTFRTTRIRVWKIEYNFTAEKKHSYVLKFEYLMPPNDFRWIDINSNQAVTISLFLQSMGTEILLETKNNKLLLECDDLCKTSANALEHIKENSSLIHNSLALNEQGVDRYESFEDVVGWMADGIQMTNRFSSVLD